MELFSWNSYNNNGKTGNPDQLNLKYNKGYFYVTVSSKPEGSYYYQQY